MLYPYPPELPTADVVALVMDALRNRVINAKESAHAVWHVAGYALSKWDVHLAPTAGVFLTREQAAGLLGSLLPVGHAQATAGSAQAWPDGIPWKLIFDVLWQLLKELVQ